MMPEEPLYEVYDLKHGYMRDGFRLHIQHLAIESGMSVGFYGPNGCGKSTLLRILAFLETPQEGELFFKGEKVIHIPPDLRKKVTILFQDPYLLKRSVFENVAYGLHARNMKRNVPIKVHEALHRVGLPPEQFAERRWFELSGSEAKRVALAARIVLDPEVLILDEPTVNFDRKCISFINDSIRKVRHNPDATLIVVSQDIVWLHSVTDRIYTMYNGCIIGVDTYNLLPGPWVPDTDGLWKKTLPDGQRISAANPPDMHAAAILHPTNIMISNAKPEDISAQNILSGIITHMAMDKKPVGIQVEVDVSGIPFTCCLTHHAVEELHLLPGKNVWVVFKASSLQWYENGMRPEMQQGVCRSG